jgi:hypothetical protein
METECKTLWMGDIQMHWDEAFIASLFATARALWPARPSCSCSTLNYPGLTYHLVIFLFFNSF